MATSSILSTSPPSLLVLLMLTRLTLRLGDELRAMGGQIGEASIDGVVRLGVLPPSAVSWFVYCCGG